MVATITELLYLFKKVQILSQVTREIGKESKNLKDSIFNVLERLERGEKISMPVCRHLFSIHKGLYELRFSCEAGEYRIFYYIKRQELIYVIHAMKKKRQRIDRNTFNLLVMRIRSLQ